MVRGSQLRDKRLENHAPLLPIRFTSKMAQSSYSRASDWQWADQQGLKVLDDPLAGRFAYDSIRMRCLSDVKG